MTTQSNFVWLIARITTVSTENGTIRRDDYYMGNEGWVPNGAKHCAYRYDPDIPSDVSEVLAVLHELYTSTTQKDVRYAPYKVSREFIESPF